MKNRFAVLYTFHKISTEILQRLMNLKYMNREIIFIPCFAIRQFIGIPPIININFTPAIWLNWTFLRIKSFFDIMTTLNKKIGMIIKKDQIKFLQRIMRENRMELYCDYTPLGYFNQDIVILNWFSSEGKNFDFDFLVFLEYDILLTNKIESLYKKYIKYDSGFVDYRKADPSWYWYRYPPGACKATLKWLKRKNLKPILYGGLFAGCFISYEALKTLSKIQLPYGFCEMRLPTVLTALGFSCARLDFPMVRFSPPLTESEIHSNLNLGIFHPVRI